MRSRIQAFSDLCRDTAQAQGHAIEEFTNKIERLRDTPPAWARPVERQLTQSEFAERESRAYLWVTVATIAAASIVVICARLTFRVPTITGAAVGLGLAAVAFAAGALGSQNTPRFTVWRITWYAVLIAVLTALAMSAVRFLRAPLGFLSAVLLIPALAAFAAGVQLGPMVSLLRLPVSWFAHRLINGALAGLVGLFWLLNAVTAVVEYIAQLIAWPTLAIVRALRGATKLPSDAGSTTDAKAQRNATIA
jgi:MFS family permease